jgi:hypothetical protein
MDLSCYKMVALLFANPIMLVHRQGRDDARKDQKGEREKADPI